MIGFEVWRVANYAVGANSNVVVPFDAEGFDTGGYLSVSAGVYVVTVPAGLDGWYSFSASLLRSAVTDWMRLSVQRPYPGGTLFIGQTWMGNADNVARMMEGQMVQQVVHVKAGDVLSLFAEWGMNAGNIYSSGVRRTYFRGIYLGKGGE